MISFKILKLLWMTYRDPAYKHFGWSPARRFDNQRAFYSLCAVTDKSREFMAELVQLAYGHRRGYGVSIEDVIDRLIEDVQAGVHPEFLAIAYGSPVRMRALDDWNDELC